MSDTPIVLILTYCRRMDLIYGSTLIFNTLRVGFPNANIHVIDNASIPESRDVIRNAALACDVKFTQLQQPIDPDNYVSQIMKFNYPNTTIFLDPDMCFWECAEGWNFDGLMAGRLLPDYNCEFSGCITHRRLHTSFLWINSVQRLNNAITDMQKKYFDFDPWKPAMYRMNDGWHRYDTAGVLYNAIPECMQSFEEEHLQCYDHLFCGPI